MTPPVSSPQALSPTQCVQIGSDSHEYCLPHALSPSILSRSLQHVINVAMRKRALLAQASLLAHARSRARTGPQTTLGRLFTFVTITGGIVVFTQGLAFTDERLAFSVQLGFRV